ncbi:MAG: hypothetical protein AAGA29_13615 [Planctomycetota bacterium]
MKSHPLRIALACSLSLPLGVAVAPPALAQDAAAVDEDIATTPTDLAELLGPDGLEGAAGEFYLRLHAPDFGGDVEGVMHWRIVVEDGRLVLTMNETQGHGVTVRRQVFAADGAFIESSKHHTGSESTRFETAVREGDTVQMTRGRTTADWESEPREDVVDYEPLVDLVPDAWMPIVLAYHIREGHEQFTFRMSEIYSRQSRYVEVVYAEHIGTEVIDVLGEEVEAHVLMVTMHSERDGETLERPEAVQEMQMYVLADGSIVRMRMEMEGMTFSAEAISAEEAEELMSAGRVEGAGEDIDDAGDAVRDVAE